MKNIKSYKAKKYDGKGLFRKTDYKEIENGIYEYGEGKKKLFVTSLSFEQESKYGEGSSSTDISQYPLEDILDKYFCHISDYYEDLNEKDTKTCYLEFASSDVNDIKKLREIIGKHVYISPVEENGKEIERLIIS